MRNLRLDPTTPSFNGARDAENVFPHRLLRNFHTMLHVFTDFLLKNRQKLFSSPLSRSVVEAFQTPKAVRRRSIDFFF